MHVVRSFAPGTTIAIVSRLWISSDEHDSRFQESSLRQQVCNRRKIPASDKPSEHVVTTVTYQFTPFVRYWADRIGTAQAASAASINTRVSWHSSSISPLARSPALLNPCRLAAKPNPPPLPPSRHYTHHRLTQLGETQSHFRL
ncbi:hypothetical protein J6590_059053 [Homalodisca vitripennis]|nr:hypothetical protein J6590_059053 [Homalodisca vitripennis]